MPMIIGGQTTVGQSTTTMCSNSQGTTTKRQQQRKRKENIQDVGCCWGLEKSDSFLDFDLIVLFACSGVSFFLVVDNKLYCSIQLFLPGRPAGRLFRQSGHHFLNLEIILSSSMSSSHLITQLTHKKKKRIKRKMQ